MFSFVVFVQVRCPQQPALNMLYIDDTLGVFRTFFSSHTISFDHMSLTLQGNEIGAKNHPQVQTHKALGRFILLRRVGTG